MIKKFLKSIYRRLMIFVEQKITSHISDEKYVKMVYKTITGKKLNLKSPKSFNEKINWLKLYDRKEEYTNLVDKYLVKEYVSNIIGDEHIIPTLGVWSSVDEIEYDKLPEKFVLKCTHDSGGVVICHDKSQFNPRIDTKVLKQEMKRNYYYSGREWPYKNVKPRIIAEPFMTDESGTELKDYKVFCFEGEPKVIQVDFDRFIDHKRNLYTTNWEYIDAMIKYPKDPTHQIARPLVLDEMLDCAKKLSAGLPHARVDFYVCGEKLYFGEITLYHGGGCEKFEPEEFGIEMGGWISVI